MIPSRNGGLSVPKTRRSRPNLRTATLILPRTGQRVKRTVTLGEPIVPDSAFDGTADPSSPLLEDYGRRRKDDIGPLRKGWEKLGITWKSIWAFATSKAAQGVVKCSIAYLIASMATFVPFLSGILGHQDGKHMVATVTVYFHPARSQGNMLEAALMALIAFVYAAFISFTSMGVSVVFDDYWDMIVAGHITVLILFCGGGLGFVAWVKQKLGNPLVNVACSLTSLAIITVLTKEGSVQEAQFSDDKVTQVMIMVLMGIFSSTAVCLLVWPVSARKELQQNLIDITDSFADMLVMITRGFLTGSEEELRQGRFQAASTRHKTVNASMMKNIKEAKWEYFALGAENEYHLQAKLVACLQRMAHDVSGLRSAATTQFNVLAQSTTGTTNAPAMCTPTTGGLSEATRLDSWISNQENFAVLAAIEEFQEEDTADVALHGQSNDQNTLPAISNPIDIFERFIMHLGPSMKSLAITLKHILDELPFGSGTGSQIAVNSHFRSSLVEAIELYSNSRKEALNLLYRSKDLGEERPQAVEVDFEEVAASCGHFSFSLLDLAEHMRAYLDILDELKYELDKPVRTRTWSWLKFWRSPELVRKAQAEDPEYEGLISRNERHSLHSGPLSPLEEIAGLSPRNEKVAYSQTISYRLWKATSFLRRDETKFAIKVGAGATIYALPSFLLSTRSLYAHWRGEWGLLSYMLVCSMTIGASNTTSYHRFMGTGAGAIGAMLAWIVSRGNVFLMAAFGWMMSLWTSYLILVQGKGPLGRFTILTYNLSALYAYSLSVRDEEYDEDEGGENPNIGEIALHRVIAVFSGCLWGLIVTRLIWPISARQNFKDGLSILLLRMGLIWKRDPLAMLLQAESSDSYINLQEEFELQRYLTKLQSLRAAASFEFEMRGPFPSKEVGQVLEHVDNMLAASHAMNAVIAKDTQASEGETDVLKYTVRERAQLCARISHMFQVMASSVKLEFPLHDALPSTEHARDRLLSKIFKYRQEPRNGNLNDEDFALLYAYALVTRQVSKEIHEIADIMESLYGVLDEEHLRLQ